MTFHAWLERHDELLAFVVAAIVSLVILVVVLWIFHQANVYGTEQFIKQCMAIAELSEGQCLAIRALG